MERTFNFFYMEPVGAIRGDKNIAHSPLYGSRSGPRRSGISAGGLVFPGIFFALPEQARLQGRAVLPPILWGAGPPQGKSGSGQKSWLRARRPFRAGSGILSLRAVLFRGGRPGAVLAGACLRAAVPHDSPVSAVCTGRSIAATGRQACEKGPGRPGPLPT